MKKSRSVSRWIFSIDWPVWCTRMRFSSSRIRRISLAWMSMSVACPCTPPSGWGIMMRAWGSANRLPLEPAQSRSAPMEAAWPMQMGEEAGRNEGGGVPWEGGGDGGLDVVYCVGERHPRRDRAPRRVDVEVDVL